MNNHPPPFTSRYLYERFPILVNRLVGVFHSRKKGWFLRFPFQLVVDVTELPVVEKPRRFPVEPGSTLQNFPLPDR
jgi:hypothetical protein